ncbi:MAG: hypothetical protein IKB51_05670 [Clostridia bacterium]|nr:hypothetical protein [Clostridia bacterium]
MKEFFSSYVYALIVVSVITALVSAIVFHSPFKGSVNTVCALAVLSTLISVFSPVISFLNEIDFKAQPDDTSPPEFSLNDETQIKETGRYICVFTEEMLVSRLGLDKDDFSVAITLDFDGENPVSIKTVTVTLNKNVSVSAAVISELVSDTLMCECLVITPETANSE